MNADEVRRKVRAAARALERLESALAEPRSNPLAIDGTIQRFEFCFELFWKAIRAALASEGIDTQTPREALSQAYRLGWLEDETAWLTMLRDRNRTSHTYDEQMAEAIYEDIRRHVTALEQAVVRLCTLARLDEAEFDG